MVIIDTLRRRKKRLRRSLILALSGTLVVSLASYAGYFERLEAWALDILFRLRGQVQAPEIVLVQINEDAFRKLKERQPLSRAYVAGLVDIVSRAGAKVIGVDIELKIPTDPSEDKLLVDAIEKTKENGNSKVVPIYALSAETEKVEQASASPPIFFWQSLKTVAGFGNAVIDAGGMVREVPLAAKTKNGVVPSFAISVLARHAGYDAPTLHRAMNASGRVELMLPELDRYHGKLLPNPRQFSFRLDDPWKINYAGARGSFETIPSEPLFQVASKETMPAGDNPFRGKIVLIGATFPESRDFYATPYGMMSGVEIHANIINTLLTRSQIRPVHRLLGGFIMLLVAVLTGVLVTLFPPAVVTYSSLIVIPVVLIPLSYLAFAILGLWVDFISPLLVVLFGTLAGDWCRQRHMQRALREFVNEEVFHQISDQEDNLVGKTKEITVLFTDVQDYTRLAETLPPERVFAIMNTVFTMMDKVIVRHHGTVIDFIGDSVLAAFGALQDNQGHARDAVNAAVEIQEQLKLLNLEWQTKGMSAVSVRVGIHTGEVFVGIIGSGARKKYDLTGDTVNSASRVEGLNKRFATSILITRETLEKVDETVNVRPRGKVQVKGRQKPVEVFEVLHASDRDTSAAGEVEREQAAISYH
jgi:adenylate cyclase